MTTGIHRWTFGRPGAPILLCLHGIGSSGDAFLPQRPLAGACDRQIVAWDAPGYRHSPDPEVPSGSGYGFDEWADAAAQVILDASPDGTADVLGVSYGGVTATRLALRHRHLVRSLILADSSSGSGTTPQRAESMRRRADVAEELGFAELARQRSGVLLSTHPPKGLEDEVASMMVGSVRFPTYRWACEAMADTDHRSDLASIDVPTLIVVGSEDQVTPPELAHELAAGIPGAKLVELADAGHLANQERPAQFNAAVATFMGAST